MCDSFINLQSFSRDSVKKIVKDRLFRWRHGDGRFARLFIPLMVGEKEYELFRRMQIRTGMPRIFSSRKNRRRIRWTLVSSIQHLYVKTPEQKNAFGFSGVGESWDVAEKCNGNWRLTQLLNQEGTNVSELLLTRIRRITTPGRAMYYREFWLVKKKNCFLIIRNFQECNGPLFVCKGWLPSGHRSGMASMKGRVSLSIPKTAVFAAI